VALPPRARARVDRFDARVEAAVDAVRGHPWADRVFYAASELGDFSLVWFILGALRGLRSEHDWHAAVRVGAGLGVESLLVNGVIKSLFGRARPRWDVERPFRLRRPHTSSFPSGHATSAFAAAGMLAEDDVLWPAYYALAVVVASSRVYVKVHHPSDVVAGAAIGVLLGHLARRLLPLPPAPGVLAGES
jgi:undecaprenyl-diphosphatase